MKTGTVLLVIVLLLRSFGPSSAKAQSYVVYLSNMTNSSGGNVSFGNDLWLAQSFESGTNLDGYTIDYFSMGGVGAPGSRVSLYNDNAGVPYSWIGGIGTILSPSTTYWIVATAIFSQATGYGHWNYASDTNYFSSDNWSIDLLNNTFSQSDNGTSWLSYANHPPFKFTIDATPVPEPSVWALLIVGNALLASLRRK
jgi:hypothetical protein